MSTNAVSALPTALAGLLKQYAQPTKADGTTATTTAKAAATPLSLGRDEAYSLSLGSTQASQAMMGYTRLGSLGAQVDTELQAEAKAATNPTGAGTVQVTVNQLAESQSLVTSLFGDPDSVSLGTGSLSVQWGSVDAETGIFTPSGDPAAITIQGGSLNDIAQSINESKIGLTAEVVESGGGYELKVSSSDTGSAKAFALSGLDELTFDPSQPALSPLTQLSEAKDASYTIDGKDYLWPSNTDVPVAFGTTADFTAEGWVTVDKSSIAQTVGKLMNSFNSLQQGIVKMTGDKGELASNANLAAGMFKRIGDAALAGYQTGSDSITSLADIGIDVQKDGTLTIDQTVLNKALSDNNAAVQNLVAQAAKGMDDAIRPYLGRTGAISGQISILGSLIGRGTSLLSYLSSGSSGTGTLVDYLSGGSRSGANTTSTTSNPSLLSALG